MDDQDSKPRILVVEDEPAIADTIVYALSTDGFAPVWHGTASAALQAVGAGPAFALAILDVGLPDLNGFELFKRLSAAAPGLPVIFLTARSGEIDRVVGLELGADDYLPKPFEPRELLARLKALLRRAAPEAAPDDQLEFGRLVIDLAARQARLAGQPCDLTAHQFDLLVVLARAAGRVLTRDQIMDALKGHPLDAFDRSIDVHISRIRAVIEDDPRQPQRVLTVRGTGYVFARKQDQAEA